MDNNNNKQIMNINSPLIHEMNCYSKGRIGDGELAIIVQECGVILSMLCR